ACRVSRFDGYLPGESAAPNKVGELWVAATESAVYLECVGASSTSQEADPEFLAGFAAQSTVFFEPGDGGGVEHFRPNIGVVARVVAAVEGVCEIAGSVARLDLFDIDAG